MKKTLLVCLISLTLLGGLVGCGTKKTSTDSSDQNTITLKVGATPVPHGELLESIKPLLKAQGIELEVQIFTDYVLPNTALASGDLDANFFQHQPFLDDFNQKNNATLQSVASIHFEPLGLYPGKATSLDDLYSGATVAVPSDTTNEARALQLLESLDVITLDKTKGLHATIHDITDNPYNLTFVELEAATIPRALPDVDFGIINGNYALDAGISDTVLLAEQKDSEGAKTFANILVVQDEKINDAAIELLIEALTSEHTKSFIETTYKGIVVPVF